MNMSFPKQVMVFFEQPPRSASGNLVQANHIANTEIPQFLPNLLDDTLERHSRSCTKPCIASVRISPQTFLTISSTSTIPHFTHISFIAVLKTLFFLHVHWNDTCCVERAQSSPPLDVEVIGDLSGVYLLFRRAKNPAQDWGKPARDRYLVIDKICGCRVKQDSNPQSAW